MTTMRQRMRGFLNTLNYYAGALESTPYDFMVERVQRLEVEVERLKKSPHERSEQSGVMDMG